MALGKLKLLRPLYLLYLPFVFWNPRKLYSEHPSRSFKPLVLERFKIWIAQFFPKPEELNRDTAPRPAINDGKRLLPVSIPGERKFVPDPNGTYLSFFGWPCFRTFSRATARA